MVIPPSSLILSILMLMLVLAASFSTVRSSNHFDFGSVKKTHLHFYFHDIVSGTNPTAVHVAAPPTVNVSTNFGVVVVADNPLTEGPQLSSKPLGRGQGMYSFASQEEMAVSMSFNFLFTEGTCKGSTITIVGRNAFLLKVRELPVVGGTGCFRGARGYALLQTYSFDTATGDAVVEVDLYVH